MYEQFRCQRTKHAPIWAHLLCRCAMHLKPTYLLQGFSSINQSIIHDHSSSVMANCHPWSSLSVMIHDWFDIEKSKLKVMGEVEGWGHIVHSVSNRSTSFLFCVNWTNHSWDMANKVFDLEKTHPKFKKKKKKKSPIQPHPLSNALNCLDSDCPKLPWFLLPQFWLPRIVPIPTALKCSNSDCPEFDCPNSDLPWFQLPEVALILPWWIWLPWIQLPWITLIPIALNLTAPIPLKYWRAPAGVAMTV